LLPGDITSDFVKMGARGGGGIETKISFFLHMNTIKSRNCHSTLLELAKAFEHTQISIDILGLFYNKNVPKVFSSIKSMCVNYFPLKVIVSIS